MITKYLVEVGVRFNPFSAQSKAVRLFLTNLPAKARQSGILITTAMLARQSTEPSSLKIKYSKTCPVEIQLQTGEIWERGVVQSTNRGRLLTLVCVVEDGKELALQCDSMTCQGLIEEVDRHSRALQKEATLNE